MKRIVFIGAGNMARGMVGGLIDRGRMKPSDISVLDIVHEKSNALSEDFGVTDLGSDYEGISGHDVLVLAVKPQDVDKAIPAIAEWIEDDTVVISIVAGLTRDHIKELLGRENPVVRVMPNLAVKVGGAASAYSAEPGTPEESIAREMFGSVGEIIGVEEQLMDLVTAVSGSGPAYFFLMVEALRDAAVKAGMPEEEATILAEQTIWGAAKVLKESELSPEALRKAVSSPGGTTLAALEVLEQEGFRDIVYEAVMAAAKRAHELTS